MGWGGPRVGHGLVWLVWPESVPQQLMMAYSPPSDLDTPIYILPLKYNYIPLSFFFYPFL